MTTLVKCSVCEQIELANGRLCAPCQLQQWLAQLTPWQRCQLSWWLVFGRWEKKNKQDKGDDHHDRI